jgi:hypothetical protein
VTLKKMTIGDTDDRQFTTILNSASTAMLIGLPPRGAEFCHTSNRLLVGCQCRRALLQLYLNSSAVSRWSFVGRSVHSKGSWALGGSLQKDKGSRALGVSL